MSFEEEQEPLTVKQIHDHWELKEDPTVEELEYMVELVGQLREQGDVNPVQTAVQAVMEQRQGGLK